MIDALAEKPRAQVLLCRSAEERERVAVLFPKFAAVAPNGDLSALAGRKVVAFGLALADAALGIAAEVKLIEAELPDPPPANPVKWAQANAVSHKQNPVPQDSAAEAPPPAKAEAAPAPTGVKVEAVAPIPSATPAPAPLDTVSAPPDDAEPPPSLPTDFPPEASLARPDKPQKHKRHLRSVFAGNTVLETDPDDAPMPAAMSEDHVAHEFAAAQKDDLRFVAARNMWLVWNDSHWKPDAKKEVDRRVVEFCREAVHWNDAASLTVEGKRKVGSKRFAGNVRDFAQSNRRIAAEVSQFDREAFLLGVPGGVVDLREGKLIVAEREHYVTRQTAVAPARLRSEEHTS